jgi:hypothetical protein
MRCTPIRPNKSAIAGPGSLGRDDFGNLGIELNALAKVLHTAIREANARTRVWSAGM